jgi:hypothetical protein
MMAKSLDNLANAAIQKKDTVEKLVTANKKLAKALANANAAIAQLCLPNPPNPLSTPSMGTTNNCHPSHWSFKNGNNKQSSPIPLVSRQARLGPYWLLLDAWLIS